MPIVDDTDKYEDWLSDQCDVVEHDIRRKHDRMTESPFVFLRATYYRWARKIFDWCPDLQTAPSVLSVGDAHTENFGTWRDGQGRLVWGVNDFDDAAFMPYALDIVRLATSARIAPDRQQTPAEQCAAIVRGYREGLGEPSPALLDENALWLRKYVLGTMKNRVRFWGEVNEWKAVEPPADVLGHFAKRLPPNVGEVRYARRVAGGGGLGRPRFVAIAAWQGGTIVHEAKALVPSGWLWAGRPSPRTSAFAAMARSEFRSPDPFLEVRDRYIYRRLAPDARKVELGDEAGARLRLGLLRAMGRELGSIHAAASSRRRAISDDFELRGDGWIEEESAKLADKVTRDFKEWKRYWGN